VPDGTPAPRNVGGEDSRVLTAEAIAAIVGGELHGDPAAKVSAVAPLDRAEPHHLTFLASAKYAELATSRNY